MEKISLKDLEYSFGNNPNNGGTNFNEAFKLLNNLQYSIDNPKAELMTFFLTDGEVLCIDEQTKDICR